ncbi:hypothetical protein PR048_000767 [Dryococelus australis]|uniref:Uncharacterized protein n=1 Tax=Dryococelus australis TaxID=614101 RepID=A0ABQ9IGY9_9NEOP|nr:hypothetical protein PR048_000767 [Dryococelus australis]
MKWPQKRCTKLVLLALLEDVVQRGAARRAGHSAAWEPEPGHLRAAGYQFVGTPHNSDRKLAIPDLRSPLQFFLNRNSSWCDRGCSPRGRRTPYAYKGRKSCQGTCIVAERDWVAMASDWGNDYLPNARLPPTWFETRSEIGPKINTENCCAIRVQSWTGDRDEVHFERPKWVVRNLNPRSAAIGGASIALVREVSLYGRSLRRLPINRGSGEANTISRTAYGSPVSLSVSLMSVHSRDVKLHAEILLKTLRRIIEYCHRTQWRVVNCCKTGRDLSSDTQRASTWSRKIYCPENLRSRRELPPVAAALTRVSHVANSRPSPVVVRALHAGPRTHTSLERTTRETAIPPSPPTQGEQGSIPGRVTTGFLQARIAADDNTAGRRIFSGVSRFPHAFIPALLSSHLTLPSSALKISLLRAAEISQLNSSTYVSRVTTPSEWNRPLVYTVFRGAEVWSLGMGRLEEGMRSGINTGALARIEVRAKLSWGEHHARVRWDHGSLGAATIRNSSRPQVVDRGSPGSGVAANNQIPAREPTGRCDSAVVVDSWPNDQGGEGDLEVLENAKCSDPHRWILRAADCGCVMNLLEFIEPWKHPDVSLHSWASGFATSTGFFGEAQLKIGRFTPSEMKCLPGTMRPKGGTEAGVVSAIVYGGFVKVRFEFVPSDSVKVIEGRLLTSRGELRKRSQARQIARRGALPLAREIGNGEYPWLSPSPVVRVSEWHRRRLKVDIQRLEVQDCPPPKDAWLGEYPGVLGLSGGVWRIVVENFTRCRSIGTRPKAKSKYRNRIRLGKASQQQSSDIHIIPYDRLKRCRERKINIKASERVNVDVFMQNERPSDNRHDHTCMATEDVTASRRQVFDLDTLRR